MFHLYIAGPVSRVVFKRNNMRVNQPVTRNERTFPAHVKLISVTDINGTILECNDAFVDVTGREHECSLFRQYHANARF